MLPGHLHKRMFMCLYKSVPEGTRAYEAAGELLKVLSAPARLAIVVELAEQPRFVHELVDKLKMSQPLVSHHLRVLRAARLVGVERRGRAAVYSLADQHVGHIVNDAIQHSREETRTMSTAHEAHAGHDHVHGPECGHASTAHEGHVDYIHEGHAHAAHEGHYDEHALPHVAHDAHAHAHGEDCGHEAVAHGDHVDYAHEGHHHAVHDDHYDEH
jgi:DNA-binding transcriptional ArsR family regulator